MQPNPSLRQQLKRLENRAQRDEFLCVISKHRPNRNRPEGIALWAKFKSAVCKWYESAHDSWGHLHTFIKILILFSFLIFNVGLVFFIHWFDPPEYVFYVTVLPFFTVGFIYLFIKTGAEGDEWGGGD